MNPNDLLTASDAELPKMLGQVLLNESEEHDINPSDMCIHCYLGFRWPGTDRDSKCLARNRIPIDDWNVAMKRKNLSIEKHGLQAFKAALRCVLGPIQMQKVFSLRQYQSMVDFLLTRCEPEHILTACGICELNSKKESE